MNRGFPDHPQAGDVSQFTGLLTAEGKVKAWGREFQELSARYGQRKLVAPKLGSRPALDWDLCITSAPERKKFCERYLEAWKAEQQGVRRLPASATGVRVRP